MSSDPLVLAAVKLLETPSERSLEDKLKFLLQEKELSKFQVIQALQRTNLYTPESIDPILEKYGKQNENNTKNNNNNNQSNNANSQITQQMQQNGGMTGYPNMNQPSMPMMQYPPPPPPPQPSNWWTVLGHVATAVVGGFGAYMFTSYQTQVL